MADGFQKIPLFRGHVGVAEQIGHTDYGIHGGADFVGHVGEEGALGAVGLFSGRLGLFQFFQAFLEFMVRFKQMLPVFPILIEQFCPFQRFFDRVLQEGHVLDRLHNIVPGAQA
ncbi:MAG: hypothetical protein BWX80_04070 [Candidatus Hydrogenedentes bacterium ADurb.Bin101]|nr:MAG: hypothetical protein BWX80_04070 [Candidatus Hydrogenedentes bacterium ADurb.Bin101]